MREKMNSRSMGADGATMLQLTHQAGLAQFVVDATGRPLPPAHDVNRLTMTPTAIANGKAQNTAKQKHHAPTTPANPAPVS